MTHRGLAASVAFVTANLTGGVATDLTAIAAAADTLVVLMAAGRLEEVCAALIAAGRPADEPTAIVQAGTTPEQRR